MQVTYVNYIREYIILLFSLSDRRKLLVSLNLSFRIVCKIVQRVLLDLNVL